MYYLVLIFGIVIYIFAFAPSLKELKHDFYQTCKNEQLTDKQCDFAVATKFNRYNSYTNEQIFIMAKSIVKD